MVHLTRIYTKTGDSGYTSLADGTRIMKSLPILEAIGAVDEANSAVGMVFSVAKVEPNVESILKIIQNDLFDVGARLSSARVITITPKKAAFLEELIDFYNEKLKTLDSFVLPSGNAAGSLLHNARTTVRRAEREVHKAMIGLDTDNSDVVIYLNRLSDLLFVLARYVNGEDEVLWVPGGKE